MIGAIYYTHCTESCKIFNKTGRRVVTVDNSNHLTNINWIVKSSTWLDTV